MKVKDTQALASALRAWLDYQALCQRAVLFSKTYMAHPLVDYCVTNHPHDVSVDYALHEETGLDAHGWTFDYALHRRGAPESLRTLMALEWVDDALDMDRVTETLLKLEAVSHAARKERSKPVMLLVVAGMEETITAQLRPSVNELDQAPETVEALLPLNVGTRFAEVDLTTNPGLEARRVRFGQAHDLKVPHGYRARLVADEHGGTSAGITRVMVWEIARDEESKRKKVTGE